MKNDVFLIYETKKESGKQARHYLKEVNGFIDNSINVGFTFDKYERFVATDMLTGRSIATGCGMNLQYHIDTFMNNCIDALNKFRNAYYYNSAVKVFNILKEQSEPITERKLRSLVSK